MTLDHIKAIAQLYIDRISQYGNQIQPHRLDEAATPDPDELDTLAHLWWMALQLREMDDRDLLKAMRWLGFIQGGLFSHGFYRIRTMRWHNAPVKLRGEIEEALDALRQQKVTAALPQSRVIEQQIKELETILKFPV